MKRRRAVSYVMKRIWTSRHGSRPVARPVGRREAGDLMDGSTTPDRQELAELLAHAGGPARPHELHGEDAVLRAFRQSAPELTGPIGAPHPRRRRRLGKPVARLAAITAAALVAGGVWAAGAGALPPPIQQMVHEAFDAVPPAPEPSTPPAPTAPDRRTPDSSTPSATRSPGPVTPSSSAVARPGRDDWDAATLVEWCRAHRDSLEPGAPALDPLTRQRLAEAAKGERKIDKYCDKVLAKSDDGASSTPQPEDSPQPSPSTENDQGDDDSQD